MKTWMDSLKHNAEPGIDECVSMLGKHIDWLHELKDTHQDPEWHAEGNVHIHTGMVLDELYQLLRGPAAHISGWQRQALILGALLHDIAKPRRTKEVEIKGIIRVACPQHEAVGRSYLAFKLMALELPFEVIWTVLGLVGEHHMPKQLVVKNQDRGVYLALSRRADPQLLYWLEVADMRGRICPDVNQQLGYLDEFKMFAEEYGIWDKPYTPDALEQQLEQESQAAKRYLTAYAIADMQSGAITMEEEVLAKHFAHKDRHPHLVVLVGPSGSGKSTHIQRHYKGYRCVSLDEIREEINGCRSSQKNPGQVIHAAKERLKQHLRDKANIVWDATNLRSDFRKIICDFGRDYHALVTMVVFLQPESALARGNANRQFAIPSSVLEKQLHSFQFPLVDEAHEYLVVGQKGMQLWCSNSSMKIIR